MTALIEAERVTKTYGGGLGRTPLAALADVSLALHAERPAITAVVGESGSGKTTLARILLGLIAPTSGAVRYKGRDLPALSRAERAQFRRDVQPVFQDPYEVYNPFYRVDHVLTTPATKFRLAPSKRARRALIEDALRTVGLRPEETLGRFPHQLSGGQRQRVMVARALLLRPRLIVADEPVSMVDASLRATILGSLKQLNQDLGISIIYITHDLATAYQVSDNILVMYRGRVAELGDVERVVKAPQHPYTQLLVSAIPKVAGTRDWLGADDAERAGAPAEHGCTFAARCPAVFETCRGAVPDLFRLEPRRAAACFQYRDAPVLPPEALPEVLATGLTPTTRLTPHPNPPPQGGRESD
jgi:peptide/nickel transport system ATP-binding protein